MNHSMYRLDVSNVHAKKPESWPKSDEESFMKNLLLNENVKKHLPLNDWLRNYPGNNHDVYISKIKIIIIYIEFINKN